MPNASRDLASLFAEAVELDPSGRAQFVRKLPDEAEREQLEALLQVHEEATGFLSQPPAGVDRTLIQDTPRPNDSVLKSLRNSFDVPQVVLTDSVVDGIDPIVRPNSPEMPRHNADSRYQLQGEIARGGMGAILKGRDVDLGRTLAVKVLLDSQKDNPEIVQRFIEEAQIGGQLQHPGVAPVYELGQFADRRPFFSMKLVKGQTLAALLAERTDPSQDRGRFLGIFEQVCQTMAYVHSRGVIHRDLKPANIMVGAFGEVQLMDWGLAKVLSAGGIADEKKARSAHNGHSVIRTRRSSGSNVSLAGTDTEGSDTRVGSVMGTPAYMPPEQALGEVDRLDERADVFGLGAILCEILTGKPPYVSENSADIFHMAARGKLHDCRQRLEHCGADPELVSIAKQCLQSEPVDRPRNAGSVADHISAYLESVESRLREAEVERAAEAARAAEERKRRKVTLALAASILLSFCVAGGGWMWIQNEQTQRAIAAKKRVDTAIGSARLHLGLSRVDDLEVRVSELNQAVAAAEQAVEFAKGADAAAEDEPDAEELLALLQVERDEASEQLQKSQVNSRLIHELESIRLSYAGDDEEFDVTEESANFDEDNTHRRYRAAFASAGLDIEQLTVAEAAQRIRASGVAEHLISALDHWARSTRRPTSQDVAEAWMIARNWNRAVRVARRRLSSNREDSRAWMYLAAMQGLAGDRAGLQQTCQQMLAQFRDREQAKFQEQTAKVCMILPDLYDLNQLPSDAWFAAAEGTTQAPVGNRLWYLAVRAMLAYRQGHPEEGLRYAELSEALEPGIQPVRAYWFIEWKIYVTAVKALCHHALDQHEDAARKLSELRQRLQDRLADRNQKSHDVWICLLLLGEATEKIGLESTSDPFEEWRTSTTLAGLPEAVRRHKLRPHLLAIANAADTSGWRRTLRKALEANDTATLKDFAADDHVAHQPPAIIAWWGSALREAQEYDAAVDLLRRAQRNHPGDFWLNYHLAMSLRELDRADDAIGYARAALAVRPTSGAAIWAVCAALDDDGQQEEASHLFDRMLQSSNMNADEIAELGQNLNRYFRFAQAELAASRAIQLEPRHVRAHAVLGRSLLYQSRYDESITALKKAVEYGPDSVGALFSLAYTLSETERDAEAAEAYRQLIGRYPSSAAHNNLGVLLRKQGKLREAVQAFREALRLDPSSRHAVSNLQRTLPGILKKFGPNPALSAEIEQLKAKSEIARKDSIRHYQKKVQLNERDVQSRYNLAKCLISDSRFEEAVEHAKFASEQIPGRDTLLLYWRALILTRRFDVAAEQLLKAAEYPAANAGDNRQMAVLLQNTALGLTGTLSVQQLAALRGAAEEDLVEGSDQLFDMAIESYEQFFAASAETQQEPTPQQQLDRACFIQVLRLRDRNEEAIQLAAELKQEIITATTESSIPAQRTLLHAQVLSALTFEDDAIDLLRSRVTQSPDHEMLAGRLGSLLFQQGRMAEAEAHYRQLVEHRPNSSGGYWGLARLALEEHDYEQALAEYDRGLAAVSDQRQLAGLQGGKAATLVRLSRWTEAIQSYQAALDLYPELGQARSGIASVRYEQGNLQAAIADARKAVEISPQDGMCHQGLAWFLVLDPEIAGEHLDEALQHARTALALMRSTFLPRELIAEARTVLGIVHYRRQEWDDALKHLQRALNDGHDEPEIWLFLAMTHWQKKNATAAEEWLAKANAANESGTLRRAQQALFREASELIGRE